MLVCEKQLRLPVSVRIRNQMCGSEVLTNVKENNRPGSAGLHVDHLLPASCPVSDVITQVLVKEQML